VSVDRKVARNPLLHIASTVNSHIKKMTKQEFIKNIQEADRNKVKLYLTRNDFASFMNISVSKVQRITTLFFDKWSDACREAGVTSGPNDATLLIPNVGFSDEECIQELLRVTKLISKQNISQKEFKLHSKMHPCTLIRKFESWENALAKIGLNVGEGYNKAITESEFAHDFINVVLQIKAIPSLAQMTNRGKYSSGTYEKKFGNYSNYKANIAKIIIDMNLSSDPGIIEILEKEKLKIKPTVKENEIRPHFEGRILGFRSFAYIPTYEQEVVAIFSNISQEIGFEIVTIREEFPDCKARRKTSQNRDRYKDCLIEFELSASDFIKHKHPINGCDLIICWENNWPDCPLEILELKSIIRKLDGWK